MDSELFDALVELVAAYEDTPSASTQLVRAILMVMLAADASGALPSFADHTHRWAKAALAGLGSEDN